jgi:uncharacterized membrane protein
MDDFAGYIKRLSTWMALFGAALSVMGLLISRSVALGMLFGVVTGIVKFRMTAGGLLRFVSANDGGQRKRMIRQNMIGYGYMGLVLFVAFSTDYLNEWATLAGLFLPNMVTVAHTVLWASRDAAAPDVNGRM